jgi:hypothetical protein
MHHKIFLVPFLADCSMADGQRLWQDEHAPIWLRAAKLRGYVQNRPVPEWWNRMPAVACAEDWFDSRDDETTLHRTDYYREAVVPDEQRMFNRDNAWASTVVAIEVVRDGPTQSFRVLSFGAVPPRQRSLLGDGRIEVLHLRRAPPLSSRPLVVSAWSPTVEGATRIAEGLGGFAFVASPAPLMRPPVAPWTLTE